MCIYILISSIEQNISFFFKQRSVLLVEKSDCDVNAAQRWWNDLEWTMTIYLVGGIPDIDFEVNFGIGFECLR